MNLIKKIINLIKHEPFIKNLNEKYTSDDIINENDIDILFPKRVFADTSTSAFTSVFLSDNLVVFTDYLFNKLYMDIFSNINDKLLENNMIPINNDENIVLIFKGGNVMHFYFNKILKQKYENIKYKTLDKNIESINIDEYLKEIATKNFSISDVDFSICIKADNVKRYNEIYSTLLEILYNSFNDISKLFDEYYKLALDDEELSIISINLENDFILNIEHLNILEKTLKDIFVKLRYIEDYKFVNRDTLTSCVNLKDLKYINLKNINEIRKSYIEYIEQIDLNKISNLLQQINFEKCCKLVDLSKLLIYSYQIIYIAKITNKQYPKYIDNIIINIKTKMEQVTTFKLNSLIKAKFYTKDKIKRYIETLENKLNELNKDNCHFAKNKKMVQIMKLNDVVGTDINIGKKNNFKVILDDLKIEDNKRIHYISFNRSIHSNFSVYDLSFDLMRIKFNTTINNKLITKTYSQGNSEKKDNNIPSEFLDVSIPNYSDYYRKHYVMDMSYTELFGIPSYTIKQIYEDLIFVLYKQSYFVPWTDKKYEKRIGRSIIFGLINSKQHFDKLLKLVEFSYDYISNNRPYPYDYIKEMNFIYGSNDIKYTIDNLVNNEYNGYVKSYNSLLINKEYSNIEDYLRNIIYFTSLHNQDTQKYLNFINNIRKEYNRNIIEIEHAKIFVNEYKENFKNLLHIMHKYISIFSQLKLEEIY